MVLFFDLDPGTGGIAIIWFSIGLANSALCSNYGGRPPTSSQGGLPICGMSEIVQATRPLRVRPAAYHLIIPLVVGPPLLIGGMFAAFSPKMSGTGLLMCFLEPG